MILAKIIIALVVLVSLINETALKQGFFENNKVKESFMKTLNGKLVNQEAEVRQFELLIHQTEEIASRCESLESQVSDICKQDYIQSFHKLEQKVAFLEDTISRQAKQLFFLKISSVFGLIGLWIIFGINSQPKYDNNQPLKNAAKLSNVIALT